MVELPDHASAVDNVGRGQLVRPQRSVGPPAAIEKEAPAEVPTPGRPHSL